MHDFPESTPKVAEVMKTNGITNRLYRKICFQKKPGSHTDPIIPDVECRRYLQDVLEAAETFTFADQSGIGNILGGEILRIVPLNKGNHFKQTDMRTAKGIKWLLENKV